ncbi:MAG: hypothetical protein IKZ55_07570 [Bacteroidales bacterium]|nr:hypothetical protein [Bacteroidales bacterium]
MKAFKDFDISDFKDMGTLPKQETTASHRPFFGFNKLKKGAGSGSYAKHSVSKLADVL